MTIILITACSSKNASNSTNPSVNRFESIKGCDGRPSCFDSIETSLQQENGNHDSLANFKKIYFYDTIQKSFSLNGSDYTLKCIECSIGRGGYVKARGKYKDGSDLELYYHWGWCSSGGSDCGYALCISTGSENLLAKTKDTYCNELSWSEINDADTCMGTEFNNNTVIRGECLDGKFDRVDSTGKTFALQQVSDRCASSVTNISYDCLAN